MQISVYIDFNNRILSLCPNDMTGNTDWFLTDTETLGLTMDDALWDDHGACLYKVEDGAAVLRSEEERRADWQEPEELDTAQSQEERIAALEDELVAAKILLGME